MLASQNVVKKRFSPRKTGCTLTFSRSHLIHVAEETIDIALRGSYINRQGKCVDVKDACQYAVQNSVHYHSAHQFDPPPAFSSSKEGYDTTFHVCYGSSLDITAQLQDMGVAMCDSSSPQHVGILNSASALTASKFARGTISQEECLCRATMLYACLRQFEGRPHHFYHVNGKHKYRRSPSACAIFSPLVPIIRRDTVVGELLDDYRTCSIVSICAPNAFEFEKKRNEPAPCVPCVPKASAIGTNERGDDFEKITLREAMRDRVYRALTMFWRHGCTDLVLSAFGCGAHGNNPDVVATIFRDLLSREFEGRFRTIVFAIQVNRTANYDAFKKAFSAKYGFVPEENEESSEHPPPEHKTEEVFDCNCLLPTLHETSMPPASGKHKIQFHHSVSFNAGACCHAEQQPKC